MVVADGLRRVEAVEVDELAPGCGIYEVRAVAFLDVKDQFETVHRMCSSSVAITLRGATRLGRRDRARFDGFGFGDNHNSVFIREATIACAVFASKEMAARSGFRTANYWGHELSPERRKKLFAAIDLVHCRLIGGLDQHLVNVHMRRTTSHPDKDFRDVLGDERLRALAQFVYARISSLKRTEGKLRAREPGID